MIKRVWKWLKIYFIPHEGNDHKPHILRPRTVLFVCLVTLVAELAFVLTATYVMPRSKMFGIIEANALVDETNQSRTADNLRELVISPLLTAAAQQKANDMVVNDYFAHTSPQGVTPWDWFSKVGYQFSFAGENLAVNFSDSQDVTNAWMNSPEHRANILNGAYTEIGIATAQGTYEGKPAIYIVEEFGTPASAPIAFVNGASAAVATASAPIAPVVQTSPVAATKIVPVKSPVTKPTPKPVAPKPKPIASSSSPVTSTMASAVNSATQQSPVAVKGVETDTVPLATTIAPAKQLNVFQQLISDPKALADDFYIALAILFAVALVLNIFIKIRIQFPRLILGGMAVIVVAGLCVLLNQNIGLFHAAIL